jgi:signal transduction histidine kinase
VATHLADERLEIVTELELLTTKVSHIKAIIATQQSYAGVSWVIESVDIAATLDDAMKLNVNSFERHKITIVREFQKIPKVRLDKQKVLQILINLFTNAKEALRDCPEQSDRRLIVRTELKDDTSLRILIIDNGVGIPSENMTRIFSHGFTTKQTGHGFGLHSCANAANELGGSLSAQSDGPGKGATFVLELPYEPIEVPATA